MNEPTSSPPRLIDQQALEARYAQRVAARLHAQADALPHDLSERLRVSRQMALQRARRSPVAAAAVSANGRGASVLSLSGSNGPGWWWRLASLAPVVALAVGLFAAQTQHDDDQIRITADIDAALLADDLPPAAYSDAGFAEFLKTSESPQSP